MPIIGRARSYNSNVKNFNSYFLFLSDILEYTMKDRSEQPAPGFAYYLSNVTSHSFSIGLEGNFLK
jgi:hypothetical protein